jgi:hypothetical protein
MNYKEINLNQYVYLEMQERDFIAWKAHDDKWLPANLQRPLEWYRSKADTETGLVPMQIHEYISVFYGGSTRGRLPCTAKMVFDMDNMKDFKQTVNINYEQAVKKVYPDAKCIPYYHPESGDWQVIISGGIELAACRVGNSAWQLVYEQLKKEGKI